MDYFDSKMSKDSALRQSKQWSREYKKWIHNKAKYPPPQTEAVYRSDLPRKDYVDRTKSKRHEILYEDEYGLSAHIEFEDELGKRHRGEIVDIDEEAKEYTVHDVDYDVETIIHFKDVIGYTSLD